jgi:ABC-2 type transport system permease protein/lipopolysaccharide transport system permease protein
MAFFYSLLVAAPEERAKFHRAWRDFCEGSAHWRLWGALGWQDILQRYRRSILGPFWLTTSMGILVCGLGILYSTLFKVPEPEYIPYVASSLIVWGLIAGLITDGCACFFVSAGLIRQLPAPLSCHMFRAVWRNLLIFIHNSVIYVVVMIFYGIYPGLWNLVFAGLGIGLICINGFWAGLTLGVLSARFRDTPPIVVSIVQVVFFLTPIFWHASQIPERSYVIVFNPLSYFLELVRQPLLGQSPELRTWAIAASITIFLVISSFAFFAKYRARVAYWV